MKRNKFLVVGMGTLGASVAKTLAEDGVDVLIVDEDPLVINEMKDSVTLAVEGDVTDIRMLEQIGARDVDAAVVCIGEHFEAAVLATANLKELKVPHIAARANNERGESILRKVGADEVFFIENTMGKFIAHRLKQPTLVREMDLGGGYRIIQWHAPKQMIGKNIAELALPKNYRIQIIAIRNEGDQSIHTPEAATVIGDDDQLLLSGYEKDLGRFFEDWKS